MLFALVCLRACLCFITEQFQKEDFTMLEFLFNVFSTFVTIHAEFLDAEDTRWVRVLTKWIPCLLLAIMIQNEKRKTKCIPGKTQNLVTLL